MRKRSRITIIVGLFLLPSGGMCSFAEESELPIQPAPSLTEKIKPVEPAEYIPRLPQSLAVDSDNAVLWYHRDGQPEKAVVDFNKALELKPDWVQAYEGRELGESCGTPARAKVPDSGADRECA